MKTLNKIKLNTLSDENLSEKQMREIKGGTSNACYCSCYYQGNGGSSSHDNCNANNSSGYTSGQGGNQWLCTDWWGF